MGNLDLLQRPCFLADKNGSDQTGIADITYTKLDFTNELFDVLGCYDAANSKWTPPAGLVRIGLAITVAGAFTSQVSTTGPAIYKNGALLSQLWAPAISTSAGQYGQICRILDYANGTDYYEPYIYADVTSGTATCKGTTTESYFWGFWDLPG